MQPIFISATGTEVGKTHAALRLIDHLGRSGIRVGACKPVETGVEKIPQDATLLLEAVQRYNPAFVSLEPEDLCAYTFSLPAAPFCADTEGVIRPDKILDKIRQLQSKCDLLVIEGAGGLMVPLLPDYMMIDIARDIKAYTLLITPSELGCINATLLNLELLKSRQLPFDWCVNLHRDSESFDRVSRPYYDTVFPDWWTLQEGLGRFLEWYLARQTDRSFPGSKPNPSPDSIK